MKDEDAQRGRRFAVLGIIAVVAIAAGAALIASQPTRESVEQVIREANLAALDARRQMLYLEDRYLEDGFERMPPPAPGDWLYANAEPGQTAAEYRQVRPEPLPADALIVLQPLGELGPEARAVLEPLRRYVELAFACRCQIAADEALPASAFDARRGQYRAEDLLAWLEANKPPEATIYAGVLDRDLKARGLNFVFGLGQLVGGVGVYSLARFEPGDPRFLLRSLKLLGHELGHCFGFFHCIYYACLLNGTNSLAETDRAPLHACPVCLEKIAHIRGCDTVERARGLEEFYRARGLEDQARRLAERRAALEKAGVAAPWRAAKKGG